MKHENDAHERDEGENDQGDSRSVFCELCEKTKENYRK